MMFMVVILFLCRSMDILMIIWLNISIIRVSRNSQTFVAIMVCILIS
jgi:hypothetical protein